MVMIEKTTMTLTMMTMIMKTMTMIVRLKHISEHHFGHRLLSTLKRRALRVGCITSYVCVVLGVAMMMMMMMMIGFVAKGRSSTAQTMAKWVCSKSKRPLTPSKSLLKVWPMREEGES